MDTSQNHDFTFQCCCCIEVDLELFSLLNTNILSIEDVEKILILQLIKDERETSPAIVDTIFLSMRSDLKNSNKNHFHFLKASKPNF